MAATRPTRQERRAHLQKRPHDLDLANLPILDALPRTRNCTFCGEPLMVMQGLTQLALTPSAEEHLRTKHGWPDGT